MEAAHRRGVRRQLAFIPYAEPGGWAEDVLEVIAALGDLVDARHAAVVVSLVEHAHRHADAAAQCVDDSDGCLTDIGERLAELHRPEKTPGLPMGPGTLKGTTRDTDSSCEQGGTS